MDVLYGLDRLADQFAFAIDFEFIFRHFAEFALFALEGVGTGQGAKKSRAGIKATQWS